MESEPPHKLAIACLFRDSAFYLREWVEHYLSMGATRLYMCDNNSVDDGCEVLRPYIESGIVILTRCERQFVDDFEGEIHTPFFDVVLRAARGHAKWVACLDSDEFVVPVHPDDSNLLSVLERYEHEGDNAESIVYAHWQLYGTSGVQRKPADRLISETFVRRAPSDYSGNRLLKAFVRTDRYVDMQDVHTILGADGYGRVAGGARRDVTIPERVCVSQLRINHYNTGDVAYYTKYKVPFYERFVPLNHPGREELLTRATRMANCEIEDRSAAERFAPAIRRNVLGPRVCVVLHMDNIATQWTNVRALLHNIRRASVVYDLYVSVANPLDKEWTDRLEAFHMECGTVAPGRGERPVEIITVDQRDTHEAAWLLTVQRIIQLDRAYDYGLKLCAASSPLENGEHVACEALLGSPERISRCIRLLDSDPKVGIIGIAPPPGGTGKANATHLDGGAFWTRYAPFARALPMIPDLDALVNLWRKTENTSHGSSTGQTAVLVNTVTQCGLARHTVEHLGPVDTVSNDIIGALETQNMNLMAGQRAVDPANKVPGLWDPVVTRALRAAFEEATGDLSPMAHLAKAIYDEARDAVHVTELTLWCTRGIAWSVACALVHSLMVPGQKGEAMGTTVRRWVAVDMAGPNTERASIVDLCSNVGLSIETRAGDTARTTLEETDLLIIDSWHTCDHLGRELARHHSKVRHSILIVGTTAYAKRGQAPCRATRAIPCAGHEGIAPAIGAFLEEHTGDWRKTLTDDHGDGFVLLTRVNPL